MVSQIDPGAVGARLSARVRQISANTPDRPEHDAEGIDVAEAAEIGLREWRQQRWSTVIPSRFIWAKLDNLDADQLAEPNLERLRAWATSPRGRNLVLVGTVGTGKTHSAIAACRPSHDAGVDIMFLPIEEMLDKLRPGGPPNALADLSEVDLLIIDEVAAERPTDWTAERFHAVVNRRWLEERPTVFTSNLSPKDLEQHVGPRTYSRMTGGAVRIPMIGRDRRRDQ